MAERRTKTIDPERVTDLTTWLAFYKQKYRNLVQRPADGALMVLSPSTMDEKNPAKIIPYRKGVDAITYLTNQGKDLELRAQAATLIESLKASRESNTHDQDAQYRTIEHQLLEAVQTWKSATNDSEREIAARQVGLLQREVQKADEARRKARAPHRYIFEEKDITRQALQYATRDPRKLGYSLYRIVPQTLTVQERVIDLK